jgi:integrase
MIFISKSKTQHGVRYVPLVPEAKEIIEKQPRQGKYIFTSTTGNPITPTVLKKLYARIQKVTGLDFVTTHVYRHSFATRFVEKGGDYKALSKILGHASFSFTLQCYAQPDFVFLEQQMAIMSKQINKNTPDNNVVVDQLLALHDSFKERLKHLENIMQNHTQEIDKLKQTSI